MLKPKQDIKNIISIQQEILLNWNENRVESLTKLSSLIQDNIDHKATLQTNETFKRLQECQIESTKEIRIFALKVMAQLLSSGVLGDYFSKYHYDIFILRSIVRDGRYESERHQALQLIYKVIEYQTDSNIIPQSLLRVVVALADQMDDRLRPIAIECLCEQCIHF
jgi:hypothetical protein